jgi:hypothetical protein
VTTSTDDRKMVSAVVGVGEEVVVARIVVLTGVSVVAGATVVVEAAAWD